MELSPYVVFRRSRLTPADLSPISFMDSWARLDALRRQRREFEQTTRNMTSHLERLVGGLSPKDRTPLLVLRRDIHNGRERSVRRSMGSIATALDEDTRSAIESWLQASDALSREEENVETQFGQAMDDARGRLKSLFLHDAVERSVQLSGQQLYGDLTRFLTEETSGMKASKRRARETSLVNFLYRAAFKPSPFGRFAEVGAFDPDTEQDPPRFIETTNTRSVTTVNRLLVNWLLAALPLVEGGLEAGYLVLNSTIRESRGVVEYIGVPPGRWQAGRLPREEVIRFQPDAATGRLLTLLAHGPRRGDELLQSLSSLTGDESKSRDLLKGLVRLGIIFYRPNVDDHDPAYTGRVLEMLPKDGLPVLSAIARSLGDIVRLEKEFGPASAPERARLLTGAEEAVEQIARAAKVAPPPSDVLKSLVYEDTPAAQPPQNWNRTAVEESRTALDSLWTLACALDSGQIRRLGLYSYAKTVMGDHTTMSFLDFFAHFSAMSDSEQTQVLSGNHSDVAKNFVRQRALAMQQIRDGVEVHAEEIRIAPRLVQEALGHLDDLLLTDSVTFRMQFSRVNRSHVPILNGVLTGYGVYVSRFSTFTRPVGDWTLASAQRSHLSKRFPKQVDLNAVLGFNFNLHPPATESVIEYPGAVSRASGQRVLRPAELHVFLDEARKRLLLWDAVRDEPVDLVPMNFMTPYGVPLLYRLLEHMSPSNRYYWNPYQDIMGTTQGSSSSPRLVVGRVVADRRSWSFHAAEIPHLSSLARGDASALDSFDQWRIDNDVPQEVFVLCQTAEEADVLAGRGGHGSRNWSDFAHMRRASVHKPMYVDLRNPLLLQSMAKSALSRPGILVTLRECLPGADDYASQDADIAAEEYFVEFNR